MKKNHSAFSGFIKSSVVALATIAFLAGGFFVPSSALAFTPPGSVNINVATGGGAVSIDTTSISVGGTGTYTSLRTINISETAPGQITAGIHTISLPNGWEFNTSAHITADNGDGLVLDSYEITPDLTSFSFNVITASNESTFVSLAGLKVRPQGTIAPSTGVITHSGVPISGVTDGSTSFGTLTTVPSNVAKVVFT
ncbi:MAG: hypothetical protein Q7K54_01105, partial [Candidatus Parcubacteria bacterium]|nr:hypothetical protein [Candidatus Parcubacteria bacterium]